MIECVVCRADNVDTATQCEACGADLPRRESPEFFGRNPSSEPDPGAVSAVADSFESLPRSGNGSFFRTLPFAVIGITGTVGALYLIGGIWPRVQALAFERGWISYVLMILFGWSLGIIGVKYREIGNQLQALAFDLVPPRETITVATANRLLERISGEFSRRGRQPRKSVLARRLWHALETFKSQGDVRAVTDNLRYEADMDANTAQNSYTILKVFIWAMPIIGFIGTVIGIGDAVGGFSTFIQGVTDVAELNEAIKPALGGVTRGLSVAFDTTLLALLLTVPIMLLASHCQKREDDALTAIERYCVDDFSSLLDQTDGARPGAAPQPTVQEALVDIGRALEVGLAEYRRGLSEHVEMLGERITAGLDAHGKILTEYGASLAQQAQTLADGLSRAVADGDRIAQRTTRDLAVVGQSLQLWQKEFTQRLNEGDRLVSGLADLSGSLSSSADAFREVGDGFESTARAISDDVSATGQRLETALAAEAEAAERLTSRLAAPRHIKIQALEVVETSDPEIGS